MEPNLDLVAQNPVIDRNLRRELDDDRFERWKDGNTGWPFLDACMSLAISVFKNSNIKTKIKYIDTPKNIREQYQYFTKANIKKLRNTGYKEKFFSLEDGIKDYIRNHLIVD